MKKETEAFAAGTLVSLELRISRLLRNGVLASGALMLVGWMLLFHSDGNPFLAAQVYRGERLTSRVTTLWLEAHQAPTLFSSSARESIGLLVCYAGLALLIGLPVFRVAMTALLFFRQRDRVLGWIALTVLGVLALSFALGLEL